MGLRAAAGKAGEGRFSLEVELAQRKLKPESRLIETRLPPKALNWTR
jgi:hypothetical protein